MAWRSSFELPKLSSPDCGHPWVLITYDKMCCCASKEKVVCTPWYLHHYIGRFLPVSCPGGFLSGGLSCSPLWVRGSFLRGPLSVACGVLSRPFLLLPTVESLGFGSHASAAAGARVRSIVYTSPIARPPAHRVPHASGAKV